MKYQTINDYFFFRDVLFFFLLLDLPALVSAIAIACFLGRPDFTSIAIFSEMTF